MSTKLRNVRDYLEELEKNKKDRPEQIKDAIDIYIDLWKKALEKGVVEPSDGIDEALSKIDRKGGLYKSAED